MSGDVRLVEELVARFPILEGAYKAHVFNQNGVLPHVFFWDLVQDVVRSFVSPQTEDSVDWRSVLAFLEEQAEKEDPEIDQVIWTSFLWYLPFPGEAGHGIVEYLGPVMSRKFKRMRPHG
ncbi:hypothetical protein [Spirillospora sp. NPDC029432]|uniref:hypothetical protein n=1 Tax=Spirillospora sp. NPDC029432 TaxID=3154599 RepID=UPI00345270F6